ncbi:hypothetical protein LSTR_LSTR007128 [Laodelphax striatellus]|uniref:BED-type domain-containing protein n=1 Tax=Laodelphax striatellus TaxID=195883 RepID=A0A482XGL7_LAOST|nr:hypothetical protein LSTR_LSTR007128 [Laodelphax striatellus]
MQVCCRACGDILTYEKNDTNPLVRHIRAKHPEKNLVCLPAVYSDQNARNSKDKGHKGKSTRKKKNGDQNDPEADTDDPQKKSSNLNFIGTKYKYTVKYYGHNAGLSTSSHFYCVAEMSTNYFARNVRRKLVHRIKAGRKAAGSNRLALALVIIKLIKNNRIGYSAAAAIFWLAVKSVWEMFGGVAAVGQGMYSYFPLKEPIKRQI